MQAFKSSPGILFSPVARWSAGPRKQKSSRAGSHGISLSDPRVAGALQRFNQLIPVAEPGGLGEFFGTVSADFSIVYSGQRFLLEGLGGVEGGAGTVGGGGEEAGVVYRGLSPSDAQQLEHGLFARFPKAEASPLSHVAGKWESPWISTTKELSIALDKYGRHGVVRIDLSKVNSQVVDLSRGIAGGGRFSRYAQHDAEVLIRGFIPPEAITVIK